MKIDITLRALVSRGSPALIGMIAGAAMVERLPTEFPEARERRVDTLVRLANGRILHVEWQSGYDPVMPRRMLGYWLLITETHPGVPLDQAVIQVGGSRLVSGRLKADGVSYRYRVIDSRTRDPAPLLASPSADDAVLAMLFGNADDLRVRVRAILAKLAGLEPNERRDAVSRLLILAGLRGAAALIVEEMKAMPLLLEPTADPFFLSLIDQGRITGEARGEAKGEVKALLRVAERRFGPLPDQARQRILSADRAEVEGWLDRVAEASDLSDLLAPPQAS